jgi:hypothetical protein
MEQGASAVPAVRAETEVALLHGADSKAMDNATIHPTMTRALTAPAVILAFSLSV